MKMNTKSLSSSWTTKSFWRILKSDEEGSTRQFCVVFSFCIQFLCRIFVSLLESREVVDLFCVFFLSETTRRHLPTAPTPVLDEKFIGFPFNNKQAAPATISILANPVFLCRSINFFLRKCWADKQTRTKMLPSARKSKFLFVFGREPSESDVERRCALESRRTMMFVKFTGNHADIRWLSSTTKVSAVQLKQQSQQFQFVDFGVFVFTFFYCFPSLTILLSIFVLIFASIPLLH